MTRQSQPPPQKHWEVVDVDSGELLRGGFASMRAAMEYAHSYRCVGVSAMTYREGEWGAPSPKSTD